MTERKESNELNLWETAKEDAAKQILKKKNENSNFFIRLLKRKRKKTPAVEETPVTQEYFMNKCPLMQTTPIMNRKGEARKVALCEANEIDREFVKKSLKYYRKQDFIANVMNIDVDGNDCPENVF